MIKQYTFQILIHHISLCRNIEIIDRVCVFQTMDREKQNSKSKMLKDEFPSQHVKDSEPRNLHD